ncbi:MAG: hypothetical protein IJO57_02210 [Bacilli bacterium]|nr:hypothetical protein [Bacilli bacterium]
MNKIVGFLKNKNTVTILGGLLCILILYIGYTVRINQELEMVNVYVAVDTIQPRTKVTSDMIKTAQIPAKLVTSNMVTNYNEIIDRYSNYNTLIAKNSYIYRELLIKEEDLPDAMLYNVPEGERIYSLPVTTASTYGNSMMPGSVVDVYVKLITSNGKIVYGQFLDNVNVLAVKDSAGNNVFEASDSTRTPAYMYFSLPEAKFLLFSGLNFVSSEYTAYEIEVKLIPNTVKYNEENAAATEVTSSYLYDFVLDELKTIDNQQELYQQLLNEMEQKNN